MHHNPAKNVLHVKQTLEELAAQKAVSLWSICARFRDSARSKLLAARAKRPTPFIDQTLYTGWNAMAVTAYLETARVLRMESARKFALRTLNRLLERSLGRRRRALPRDRLWRRRLPPTEKIPGTLDDYAFTVHACIDAWLASGKMNYLPAAHKAGRRHDCPLLRPYGGSLLRCRRARAGRHAPGRTDGAAQAAAGFAHAGRQSHRSLGAAAS